MKSDKEIIWEGYEQVVQQLFKVYFEAMISDPTETGSRFLKGIANARKARQQAIELIKET